MKAVLFTVAVLLIAGGIVSLLTGGLLVGHHQKTTDVGSVQLRHDSTSAMSVAPVVSVAAILGGAVLVFVGLRSR